MQHILIFKAASENVVNEKDICWNNQLLTTSRAIKFLSTSPESAGKGRQ